MSNVSQEAPVTGAAGGRGILVHVGPFLGLLAFALLAFAHLSNATESELVPAAAPTGGKTVEVAISNFTFTPNELTIAPGTTVKWVNHDDIPHLVAEKALAFKSQALDTNDSFSFTFTKPGDVEYFCVLHPHMIGKITVKAGGA
ncbi:MAG: cupredoxin family copper-binding protein [Methyloceanibacter sp.]